MPVCLESDLTLRAPRTGSWRRKVLTPGTRVLRQAATTLKTVLRFLLGNQPPVAATGQVSLPSLLHSSHLFCSSQHLPPRLAPSLAFSHWLINTGLEVVQPGYELAPVGMLALQVVAALPGAPQASFLWEELFLF